MGSMLAFLLGDGVFVSNGELWRKQRRMIDPAFNQARIQDVFPLMRDATEAMGARFRAHADGERAADRRGDDARHRRHHLPHHLSRARSRGRSRSRIFQRLRPLPGARLRAGRLGAWPACRTGFRPAGSSRARHARIIRGLLERGRRRRGSTSSPRRALSGARTSSRRCSRRSIPSQRREVHAQGAGRPDRGAVPGRPRDLGERRSPGRSI